ncbi:MAG: RidA family protein [Pseudomonadota bacterium]
MNVELINAPDAHDLKSGYSQAVAVSEVKRTVYVSGQIPVRPDGTVPETFREQAEQAWANVEAQLRAAGMGMGNIVRHTTYLSDRQYRAENSEVRRKVLQGFQPALTVIIAGIFDGAWLLEIEAVAVE